MQHQPKSSIYTKLFVAIFICETTGFLSAFLSATSMNPWFEGLNKPSFNPPSYLFAPVWTILYLLMGIALWLIWKIEKPSAIKTRSIQIFAIQLFLNFWWSILFFKFHSPFYALINIVLLFIAIACAIFYFYKLSPRAAYLLIPYIAWVGFATLLNAAFWVLN